MERHGRRWYRVLYVGGGGAKARSLGRVDEPPTQRALDPFLSRLLLGGVVGGELVLVDEATGRAVARRPVRPEGHPARPPASGMGRPSRAPTPPTGARRRAAEAAA
jgi:hypothetical protein